jgi:hypothetical protein
MSQPHEHLITAAPEHLALVVMGCPSPKHCRGQCGSFISTGADIRALKQDRGERQLPPVNTCNPLREPSVHARNIGHGSNECPGQMMSAFGQILPTIFRGAS